MLCLGIDWGEKKIGLALGHEETKVASPFAVLDVKSWSATEQKMRELLVKEKIEKIILGRPRHLSGAPVRSGKLAKFVEFLRAAGLPLIEIDERFSTKGALSIAKTLGINRAGRDDADAAAIILQTYFDGLA